MCVFVCVRMFGGGWGFGGDRLYKSHCSDNLWISHASILRILKLVTYGLCEILFIVFVTTHADDLALTQ